MTKMSHELELRDMMGASMGRNRERKIHRYKERETEKREREKKT